MKMCGATNGFIRMPAFALRGIVLGLAALVGRLPVGHLRAADQPPSAPPPACSW